MAAPRWTVAPDGVSFLRDGVPTFLLADTLWAAFGRMSDDEWVRMLELRRSQGFNAVNISVLPIEHDRSGTSDTHSPFALRSDGHIDVTRLDSSYFERARRMVDRAAEHGMTAVLVLLWNNYLPGTWAAARTPWTAMDARSRERYVEMAVRAFAGTGSIFAISGDDDFTRPDAIATYLAVAATLAAADLDSLITLHSTPHAVMPPEVATADTVGFYGYQSGHDSAWYGRAVEMADRYRRTRPRRPVVNMEPCYEAHGDGAGGLHGAAEVRAASWAGILAGAGAGLGYGAHGAWSWHHEGEWFSNPGFSGPPPAAEDAVRLPGAADMGVIRRVVEHHGLFDLELASDAPAQEGPDGAVPSPVVGRSRGRDLFVVYLPTPGRVTVDSDLEDFDLEVLDLDADGAVADPVARRSANGCTTFMAPPGARDHLYVLRRG